MKDIPLNLCLLNSVSFGYGDRPAMAIVESSGLMVY
jgi:hypothetical protein